MKRATNKHYAIVAFFFKSSREFFFFFLKTQTTHHPNITACSHHRGHSIYHTMANNSREGLTVFELQVSSRVWEKNVVKHVMQSHFLFVVFFASYHGPLLCECDDGRSLCGHNMGTSTVYSFILVYFVDIMRNGNHVTTVYNHQYNHCI